MTMKLFVAILAALCATTRGFTHGWGTVTDMLGFNPHASGNGRYNGSPFAMKHWEWVANNYAVVVLGRFEDFDPVGGYNCTCPQESSRVQVARCALYSASPSLCPKAKRHPHPLPRIHIHAHTHTRTRTHTFSHV